MKRSWRVWTSMAVGLVTLVQCSDSDSTDPIGGGGAAAGGGTGNTGNTGATGGGGPATCSDPVDVGPIAHRAPDGGWRDVAWEDPYPDGWETIDVSTQGVQPDAGDVSSALQAIIDSLSAPTILEIPAGRYEQLVANGY